MRDVQLPAHDSRGLSDVLGPALFEQHTRALERCRAAADRRTVWHVNSTAAGGGVAQLLSTLLPYEVDAGVDARWLVLEADAPFFDLTKRLHNQLHGGADTTEPLGSADRALYDETSTREGEALAERVSRGDVVVLHDPQTAGLIPYALRAGAAVAWRCHIGADAPDAGTRSAWDFLRDDVEQADTLVFSRAAFVWDGLPDDRTLIAAPCIDVLSPTNRPMAQRERDEILDAVGLVPRSDSNGARRARMVEDEPVPPDALLVVQVSRWDRLKDPVGLIDGFCVDPELDRGRTS